MFYFQFYLQLKRQKEISTSTSKKKKAKKYNWIFTLGVRIHIHKISRYEEVVVYNLNSLTCVAAIIGEDSRDRLQCSSCLSPCSYQTEEASAGKCC